jgi:hypothetical protein
MELLRVHLFEKLAESFVVIGKGPRKMICQRNSWDGNLKKFSNSTNDFEKWKERE